MEDAAVFVTWPPWADALIPDGPRPLPIRDFLELAKSNAPDALVRRFLEIHGLPAEWLKGQGT